MCCWACFLSTSHHLAMDINPNCPWKQGNSKRSSYSYSDQKFVVITIGWDRPVPPMMQRQNPSFNWGLSSPTLNNFKIPEKRDIDSLILRFANLRCLQKKNILLKNGSLMVRNHMGSNPSNITQLKLVDGFSHQPIWKRCAVVKLDHESPEFGGSNFQKIFELPPLN